MRYFKIEHETVSSRSNQILKKGEVVQEHHFIRANIQSLINRGFIVEISNEMDESVFVVSEKNKPTWKKRLAIVTGVWKRPEIFEMFANATKKLNHPQLEIIVIVAGSEGEQSKSMVEKHGFIYIEVDNEPLASKMNSTIVVAGQLNADYVLCVGSDDVITQNLLDIYADCISRGIDYVGVLDWYFYDTVSGNMAYWGGYRDARRIGHTCGAGRLISSNLLSKWNFKPWLIKDSHVLDNSMQTKLKQTPHTFESFSLKERGVYAFDLKSNVNMTKFELWDNTEYIQNNKIILKLKELCAE